MSLIEESEKILNQYNKMLHLLKAGVNIERSISESFSIPLNIIYTSEDKFYQELHDRLKIFNISRSVVYFLRNYSKNPPKFLPILERFFEIMIHERMLIIRKEIYTRRIKSVIRMLAGVMGFIVGFISSLILQILLIFTSIMAGIEKITGIIPAPNPENGGETLDPAQIISLVMGVFNLFLGNKNITLVYIGSAGIISAFLLNLSLFILKSIREIQIPELSKKSYILKVYGIMILTFILGFLIVRGIFELFNVFKIIQQFE